jgi:hypothetical protein
MEAKTTRVILFLFGCILTRYALAFIAYKYHAALPVMGVIAIGIASGFLIIFFGGYRKTGREVFGDRIWWNSLRPIHAFLYLVFAWMALIGPKQYAWVPLVVDATIGLGSFLLFSPAINRH